VVFDPHDPVPEVKGEEAIRQGFEWGLGNMENPGFAIRAGNSKGAKSI